MGVHCVSRMITKVMVKRTIKAMVDQIAYFKSGFDTPLTNLL
jgi:hypothetical protein